MTVPRRGLAGAFAAMLFVGIAWGANLPVSKVLIGHFDVVPMTALRLLAVCVVLAALLAVLEGAAALRIGLSTGRFLALGLMMGGFFIVYTLGLQFSHPVSAAAVLVAGPLVSAATVRLVTGARFDPGFGVALALTLVGGGILAFGRFSGSTQVSLGWGEAVVLFSNAIWALYSIKAQVWFASASQLRRTYVASVSALGWTTLFAGVAIAGGAAAAPWFVRDGWAWAQLVGIAVLATGLGGVFWNVGASRLGVAVASLWINLVPLFAVLISMAYGFVPNGYQIAGGLVALSGVVYMQWRKMTASQ
ncbi:MAG: DMT family transporter [Alphaproteobacteria bacterium]|nr:DMT family transporter [Alphaproteobacteria bacterium]